MTPIVLPVLLPNACGMSRAQSQCECGACLWHAGKGRAVYCQRIVNVCVDNNN